MSPADQRTIAGIACPYCNAAAGSPCVWTAEQTLLRPQLASTCHNARRVADKQRLTAHKKERKRKPVGGSDQVTATTACADCGAQPGEPCRGGNGYFFRDQPEKLTPPLKKPHEIRSSRFTVL
jgi:Zn ribbon nucleic-acid-binding protein